MKEQLKSNGNPETLLLEREVIEQLRRHFAEMLRGRHSRLRRDMLRFALENGRLPGEMTEEEAHVEISDTHARRRGKMRRLEEKEAFYPLISRLDDREGLLSHEYALARLGREIYRMRADIGAVRDFIPDARLDQIIAVMYEELEE